MSFPSASFGAIVMAGGRSQRMRASGSIVHKALRELNGRTLIEHNLAALFASGFGEVFVAVNAAELPLQRWLATEGQILAKRHASLLSVLEEPQPLGTIGAAGRLTGRYAHLLVVNVDNITGLDLPALCRFHLAIGGAFTVAAHAEPFRIPFGELQIDGSRVLACREKPVLPVTISSGTYVLGRAAMAAIQPGCRTHAPDLMNRLIADDQLVACFRHEAWWFDINDEAVLAAAEEKLAGSSVAKARSAGAA